MSCVGDGHDLGRNSLLGGDQPFGANHNTNGRAVDRFAHLGDRGNIAKSAEHVAAAPQPIFCWTAKIFQATHLTIQRVIAPRPGQLDRVPDKRGDPRRCR